jgi:hypothetical protein
MVKRNFPVFNIAKMFSHRSWLAYQEMPAIKSGMVTFGASVLSILGTEVWPILLARDVKTCDSRARAMAMVRQ